MTPPTPIYIYCPQSGDRVLAERNHPAIRVVRYRNGCRHVTGGVHLEWTAAEAGRHWRAPGRTVLARCIEDHGGIAWDEGGTLHAVVPRIAAQLVYRLLARVLPVTSGWRHPEQAPDPLTSDVGVRLLLAGLVDTGGMWLPVAPVPDAPLPREPWTHPRPRLPITGPEIARFLSSTTCGVDEEDAAAWWRVGEDHADEQVRILGLRRWDREATMAWAAALPEDQRAGMDPSAIVGHTERLHGHLEPLRDAQPLDWDWWVVADTHAPEAAKEVAP